VYMGVCRLPPEANGSGTHRRIDIRMIPRESWACALLYFTGSDHFNRHRPTDYFSLSLSLFSGPSNRWSLCRSMRLWARRNGLSLSEKDLRPRCLSSYSTAM
jgi:hypothetical protein